MITSERQRGKSLRSDRREQSVPGLQRPISAAQLFNRAMEAVAVGTLETCVRVGGSMGYSLELRHTGCQMLMEYWARMLANGSVPPHAKIQPRALKSILPMVFTLNMTHAGEARFGGRG